MKTKISISMGLILTILLPATFIFAEETPAPDVQTIVEKANHMAYYQGEDGKARVKMTITDDKDQKRTRDFTVLRRDDADGGDQKYYVYFREPADVRKMVFMVHKHAALDKDDDRWLYLPSLDLVKRIAAGDKRTSFVGSDFLYEDVSGRSLQEDTHELTQTTDKFYVVKNVPKDPKTVGFSYYNVWIDRNTFMPMKMEYFDDQGRLYRTIESLELKDIPAKDKDGKDVVYPTVVKSKVTDLNKKSTTLMEFSDIEYNIGLKDIFTERYLRRPPREAVR
ncbi:MAG: outer membrane lipoprotein-sorting protein [Sedimentisphaerales bacterium]|nr:outer membrane lipoprotein-sorting protein [Sedimentisphaerales bacterium]